jgi:hypothetical protein
LNVKALVELHQQYLDVPQSLSGNFGDGYLYQHNILYRNVRKQGILCGTTYSVGGNSRWYDYLVFPLVNFDELLENKEIPYVDNYNVLLRLCQKHPKLILPEKFIRDSFKRNYLLHETCHCIAHDFLLKPTKHSQEMSVNKISKSIRLLNSLLGESFANSVELISSAIADTNAHIFLHALNSYIPYSPKSRELVQKAIDEIGLPGFLKLAFTSYFFNNLLGYEHSKANAEKILAVFNPYLKLEIKNGNREIILDVLFKCCLLNTRFRDETSIVYFSSLGLGDTYKNLSAEKVFSDPKTVKNITEKAIQLCDLVLDEN